MELLKELGYEITYSGPSTVTSWGKYFIAAKKVENGMLQGIVAGYGDDEATAIADAVKTLGGHKS